MFRRRTAQDEKGQAMVEFALILPPLLLIMLAILQFGVVFNDYLELTDGVRAGARTAAVSRQASNPVAATVVGAAAGVVDRIRDALTKR